MLFSKLKKSSRIVFIIATINIVLFSYVSIFISSTVNAQTVPTAPFTASFIDRSTILVTSANGVTTELVDANWDRNWNYRGSFGGSCEVVLDGFDGGLVVGFDEDWSSQTSRGDLRVQIDQGTGCQEIFDQEIAIGASDNAKIAFEWVSSDTIARVNDPNDWSFVLIDPSPPAAGSNRWFSRLSEQGNSTCRDTIVVEPSGRATLYEQDENGGTNTVSAIASNCTLEATLDNLAGDASDANTDRPHYNVPSGTPLALSDPVSDDGTAASSGAATGGASGSSEDQPSCANGGGELSWIVCPILGYMDEVISYLDNQINTLLQIPESYYNDSTIEQVWQRMRDLAYLLLIPTLLIMVIGTALGFQFLDAYTVKRALPRLFVAVIFIAISLPILRLLIGTVNIVGQGVYGLISSVVDPRFEFSLAGLFDPNFTQGGFATLALGGAVVTAKIWIVAGLFLAFSVFLSIATIFLLLAFRQLLIVALMIIAPLAILAWIFPGNDKPWKLWWASFWKLLILYPLIMGLLAIGRVFAYVVDSVGPGGLVEVVLKIFAYIGPFFLIPSAFKYAGGVFANIGGMVNNKEKGVFDRLSKARGQSLAQGGKDALQGNLFKGGGDKSFRQRYNRTMQYAANQKAGGLAIRPATRNARVKGSIADNELEHGLEAAEKLPGAKAFFSNDDLMEGALLGDGDRTAMMQYYRKKGYTEDQARLSTERGLQMRSAMGAQAFNLAALAKLPATGTYATEENLGQWHQSIVKATHGDKNLQGSLIAAGKGGFRNAQRYEASEAGFGDHFAALEMAEHGSSAAQISRFIHDRAYKAGGPSAVIGSRNDKTAKMFAGAINRDIDTADSYFINSENALGVAQARLSQETDQTKIPALQAEVEKLTKTRDVAYTDKMRSRAAVDQIHDSVGQAKQIVSDVLADDVFSKEVEFEAKKVVPRSTGRVTKDGKPEIEQVVVKERVKGNRVEELKSYHDDKIFQESKYVYGNTEEEQDRRQAQGGEPPKPGTGFAPPTPGSSGPS